MFSLAQSIQNACRSIMKSFYEIRIIGEVPNSTNPLVLVGNHVGFIDGFIMLCATKRPISVLIKTEVFNKFTAPVINVSLGIETDWKDADRAAVVLAQDRLASGIDVGLFPEGTRCRGDFAWLKDGALLINSQARADFVPVFIFGSRLTGKSKNWIPPFMSLIEIVIGEPIKADLIYSQDFDALSRKQIAIAGERLRQSLQLQLQVALTSVSNTLPEDDVS
jgi:1-acyl-sn-glycerol-3-phosphate acyltransferase